MRLPAKQNVIIYLLYFSTSNEEGGERKTRRGCSFLGNDIILVGLGKFQSPSLQIDAICTVKESRSFVTSPEHSPFPLPRGSINKCLVWPRRLDSLIRWM